MVSGICGITRSVRANARTPGWKTSARKVGCHSSGLNETVWGPVNSDQRTPPATIPSASGHRRLRAATTRRRAVRATAVQVHGPTGALERCRALLRRSSPTPSCRPRTIGLVNTRTRKRAAPVADRITRISPNNKPAAPIVAGGRSRAMAMAAAALIGCTGTGTLK
jgi:hypothetical protein